MTTNPDNNTPTQLEQISIDDNKPVSKLPPLIWSVGIYNILVSLLILWLIAFQQALIQKLYLDNFGLDGLYFTIPYIIVSGIGLASGIGLLLKQKWAWYGTIWLIIFTVLNLVVNAIGLSIYGLSSSLAFVRLIVPVIVSWSLVKSLLQPRIKDMYGVKKDSNWIMIVLVAASIIVVMGVNLLFIWI